MLLEEATTDDIFRELVSRFPLGVIVAALKTPEGSPEEAAKNDGEPTIYRCDAYACLGLIQVAQKKILKEECRRLRSRNASKDPSDEEDS